MQHTVFMPDVSSRDWASLIALGIVALVVIITAVCLLRRVRARAGAMIAFLIISPTLLGLGSLFQSRGPQFTEVSFSDREMIVSSLSGTTSLALNPDNKVSAANDGILFVSGRQSIKLPYQASWHLDGLVVDARYLANEFAGRSR